MRRIFSREAPQPIGHYSPAIVHNGLVYLSAQLPLDPIHDHVTPKSPFDLQVRQLLANCSALLAEAGSTPASVISVSLFLTTLDRWTEADQLLAEFFGEHRPARAVLCVATIRKGFAAQMSMIAATASSAQA